MNWKKKLSSKLAEGNNKDWSDINDVKHKKTLEKINEVESWLFENINNIEKTIAALTKKQGLIKL